MAHRTPSSHCWPVAAPAPLISATMAILSGEPVGAAEPPDDGADDGVPPEEADAVGAFVVWLEFAFAWPDEEHA
jgi:hypothetical protein